MRLTRRGFIDRACTVAPPPQVVFLPYVGANCYDAATRAAIESNGGRNDVVGAPRAGALQPILFLFSYFFIFMCVVHRYILFILFEHVLSFSEVSC